MKIDQRLALALHEEMNRQKTNVLSITHEELAKQIGSVREVVSKTLKYMEEEGVVRLGRGKIEILEIGNVLLAAAAAHENECKKGEK